MRGPYPKNEVFLFWMVRTQVVLQTKHYPVTNPTEPESNIRRLVVLTRFFHWLKM